MAGHSPSKTGVNALCPASTSLLSDIQDVDARDKRGHDVEEETYGASST
jgi:hypothetical protein